MLPANFMARERFICRTNFFVLFNISTAANELREKQCCSSIVNLTEFCDIVARIKEESKVYFQYCQVFYHFSFHIFSVNWWEDFPEKMWMDTSDLFCLHTFLTYIKKAVKNIGSRFSKDSCLQIFCVLSNINLPSIGETTLMTKQLLSCAWLIQVVAIQIAR